MLFVDKILIDNMWMDLCEYYIDGLLNGIKSMKVSTNVINPRAKPSNTGVIILYCNNSSDKDNILEIGKNLLKLSKYSE
jgi:hypothetical protein